MSATLMKGKPLADRIRAEVAEDVRAIGHIGLVTVLVGDDPASEVYIRLKHKAAVEAGIDATDLRLPDETSEDDLLAKVEELNADAEVDAILVQLPLPKHIDEAKVIRARRPGEGRRRLSSVQRRRAVPRPADARPGDAARRDGDAGRAPHRARRRARGRDRPQRHRRQADGAPAACRRTRRSRSAIRTRTTSPRHTLDADVLVAAVGVPGDGDAPTWSRPARS